MTQVLPIRGSGAPIDKLNPSTGLEGDQKTPVFPVRGTQNSYQPITGSARFGGETMYGREGMPLDPTKFDFPLIVDADNEELRAQDQSVAEQTLYGAGRLIGTTATKFMEGLGYMYGVGEALVRNVTPGIENTTLGEALDNGWTKLWGNAEESIKEALPIYHTNKYNEGNILKQMGTYGFYMDDMVDGVAFLLSALVGSKGVSAAGKATGTYSAIAKEFSKATKMARAGKVAKGRMLPLNSIVEEMDLVSMSAVNSVVEASFEAKDTMDSLMSQGVSKEEAAKAAQGTFWWNVGVLMGPNYITNSMFFGKANPITGRVANIYKDGKLVHEVTPLTKGQKAGAFAEGMLTSMGSESQEENIQLAIQDYFTKRARGEDNREQVDGIFGNWAKNWTTDEGQKSMALGALVGMIPGGYGGMKQAEADRKNEAVLHNVMNATIASTKADFEAQDIWLTEEDGKTKYIDPITKRPVVDPLKLATTFALSHYTNMNAMQRFTALASGNELMLDRVDEESLASFALPHMGSKDGQDVFEAQLQIWAKQKAESVLAKGEQPDEKEINKIVEKYKAKGRQYKVLYDNIQEVFAGLYDFQEKNTTPDKKDAKSVLLYNLANQVKDNAIRTQFMASVEQMFWTDKLNEIDGNIFKLQASPAGQTEVGKEKVKKLESLKEAVNEQIKLSEARVKEVLKPKLWEDTYNEAKKKMMEAMPTDKPTTETKPATTDVTAKSTETQAGQPAVVTPTNTAPVGTVADEISVMRQAVYTKEEEEADYKARKEAMVAELEDPSINKVTGAETKGEQARQLTVDELQKRYGDSSMADGNLSQMFNSTYRDNKLHVIYNEQFGELFIDPETNEVVFKNTETGKEYIIGKTTDESFFNGELTVADLGIIPIRHTIFDISYDTAEAIITVQGRRYKLPINDPYSAITEDENGNPVSITLKDLNNVPLTFTNKTLVEELAYSIALLEEAREEANKQFFDKIDAEFTVVEDRGTTYYVYQKGNGVYEVSKPEVSNSGKMTNKIVTSPVVIERVLSNYFKDVYNVFNRVINERIAAGQRITPEQIDEINKRVENEIKELTGSSRPATEKDAITKLSATTVPDSKEKKDGETGETSVGKTADGVTRPQSARRSKDEVKETIKKKSKDETDIVDEKADELSKKKKTKAKPQKNDADGIETDNTGDFIEKREMAHSKSIAHPATAMAWKAEDNPDLDNFLSDPTNDLKGYTFVASIDKLSTDERWASGDRDDNYIREHIDDEIDPEDDNFDSLVDNIVVKLTLLDSEGNEVGVRSMYLHRSDFAKEDTLVKTAKQVQLWENGQMDAYEESRRQMILEERQKTRELRKDVIKKLLDGKEVVIKNLRKGTGIMYQDGVSKNVLEVTDSVENGQMGIADSVGTIWNGKGESLSGVGSPGNVFWEVNFTANGESRLIKMNVAKLSEEHAAILLKAYHQAANSGGGLNSIYEGDEVEGDLTCKEVIDYLVFEGPKTDQNNTDKNVVYQEHLTPKTMYMVDGVLHYGKDKSINLRKKNLSKEETVEFTDHVTMYKNYNVPLKNTKSKNGIGGKIEKTFRIGSFTATAGESYQSFLLRNGMVLTDLAKHPSTGTPFHAPAVMFDYKKAPAVKKTPVKENKKEEPKKAKKDEVKQVEVKKAAAVVPPANTMPEYKNVTNVEDWDAIPAGVDIFTWVGGAKVMSDDDVPGEAINSAEIHVIGVTAKDAAGNTVIKKSPKIDRKDNAKIMADYDGMVLNKENAKKLANAFNATVKIEIEEVDDEAVAVVTTVQDLGAEEELNDIWEGNENTEAPFAHKVTGEPVQPGDVNQAVKNLRKKLGKDFTIKIEEDLIRIVDETGTVMAFATFQKDCITLSKKLAQGSEYEEAFHRVSLLYLSPEQQKEIYKEARVKYNMKNASDRDVNERLAQEYREMETRGEKAKAPTTVTGKIKQFFLDLFDFITTIFTGRLHISNLDINNLFRVTQKSSGRTGRLWYSKPNPQSYALMKRGDTYTHAVKGRELKMIKNSEQLTDAVRHLIFTMVKQSGVTKTKDISNMNYMAPFDAMRVAAASMREREQKAASVGQTAQAARFSNLAATYEEIVANYDIFQDLMKSQLEAIGIRTILPDNPEEVGEDGAVYRKYDKASFELNSKDNAGAAIKLVIATLNSSDSLNPATGFKQLVDYDVMYDTLLEDLGGVDTYEDMIKVLKRKVTPPYKDLVAKLEEDGREDPFDTLGTQFYQAMRKPRYNFINAVATKKGNKAGIDIVSAETQRVSKSMAVVWGQSFLLSEAFIEGKANKDYLKEVIADFTILINKVRTVRRQNKNDNAHINNINEILEDTIKLFNKVSIPVDMDVLNTILYRIDPNNKNNALYKFILEGKFAPVFGPSGAFGKLMNQGKVISSKGSERRLDEIFSNEALINDVVGPAYLEVHGGMKTNTILGPGGNPYYLISERSYITDLFHAIRNNPEYGVNFSKLKTVPFNEHSFLLKQLASKEARDRIRLTMFAGMAVKDSADRGRSYSELNSVEDTLVRIGLFEAGKIVMPQLGDRGHLYTIDGLAPLSFNLIYDPKTKSLKIPEAIVEQFYFYAVDEYTLIKKCKEQIAEAKKNGTEDQLKENFHFVYNEDGSRNYEKANGLKFQHFTEFNGKGYKLDNNVKEPARNNTYKGYVAKILNDRLNDALNKLDSQGIINISRNEQGEIKQITNRLFSDDEIKRGAEKSYDGNTEFYIRNKVANFMFNSIMSTIESEKVLFMSPSYYKDLDDKIKRYTAIASTGAVPRLRLPDTLLKDERLLHDNDQFNSAVLKTQKTSISEEIYEHLKKKFVAEYETRGMKKEAAEAKAESVLKGYKKTDSTDGQAYISPYMFRAIRIRMGDWTSANQEAFDLSMEDRDLTVSEQNKVDKLFMHPLKFGYFGPQLSPSAASPLYYKMSLATLTPRLVKGTQLEPLYEAMTSTKDPVDMVLFDSAVKTGVDAKTPYYVEGTDLVNISEISNMPLTRASFQYLRRQTFTEPHMELRDVVKTQVRKINLSNIVDERKYTVGKDEITGKELKDLNRQLMTELSNRGVNEFLSEVGIDPTTLMNMDMSKLYTLLRTRARMSGMPDALVDALAEQTDGIRFEPDALPDRKWLQSTQISLLAKKAVDIVLPGTSLIQMSNFGLRSAEKDDSLKLIDSEGYMEAKVSIEIFRNAIPNYHNLTYSQRLEYVNQLFVGVGYRVPTQGLVSTVPLKIVGFLPETSTATIVLPAEFTTLTGSDFDIDKLYFVRPNYKVVKGKVARIKFLDDSNSTVEERLEIFSHEAIEKDARFKRKAFYTAVKDAYGTSRAEVNSLIAELKDQLDDIVTEESESEIASPEYQKMLDKERLELKKSLSKAFADKAKLRAEINRRREAVEAEIEDMREAWKDNHHKEFLDRGITQQNTKKALENRLIETYFAALLSQDNVIDNYIPLDVSTDLLKDIAKDVAKLEGTTRNYPSLYTASFIYQQEVKNKYLWGKEGIGPFARANVHHVLGQIAGIRLNAYLGVGNTVEVDGNVYTDLSQIYGQDGESILDWLSALINAHVDIAKDAYIFALNVNDATYSVAELLVRAGVGKNAFLFLAQPILKEYAELKKDHDGRISGTKGKPIDVLRKKYLEALYKAKAAEKIKDKVVSEDEVFDEKRLKKDINEETAHDAAYYARQLQILSKFADINKFGTDLFEAVEATTVDTKRFGNNLVELRRFNKLVDKVLSKGTIVNMDKLFELTYVGQFYANSVQLGQKIFKDSTILASDGVTALMDRIMMEIGKSEDISVKGVRYLNMVSDEIFAGIVGRFMANNMKVDQEKLKSMMFGDGNMVHRLNKIKKSKKYKSNPLIKLLQPSMSFEDNVPDLIITFTATDTKTKWTKDRIIDGWAELLTSTDENVQAFAKDLVTYSFYTSGFRKTMHSFFHYIPPMYLKEIGFSDYMGNMRNEFNDINNYGLLESVHDDVFQNLWEEDDIVPFVSFSNVNQRRRISNGVHWGEKYPFQISIHNGKTVGNEEKVLDTLLLGYNEYNEKIYVPFIKMEVSGSKQLYKFVGYNVNEDGTTEPVYVISQKKGFREVTRFVNEYGHNGSIFEDNKTKALPSDVDLAKTGFYEDEEGNEKVLYDFSTFQPIEPDKMKVVKPVEEETVSDTETATSEEENKVSDPAKVPTIKNHRMAYDMAPDQNVKGVQTTTIQAIEEGWRTASTRSYALGQVGDVITFEGRPTKYVITQVEEVTDEKANDPAWVQAWSKKEGWTVSHFTSIYGGKTVHAGSFQTTFKKQEGDTTLDGVSQQEIEKNNDNYKHCK